MKSALAIQCLPLMQDSNERIYSIVDKAIAVIEESGLPFTVGPMETVVEGPMDQLLEVAGKAHQAILESGSPAVATYMKLFSSPNLGSSDEKTEKYRRRGH